MLLKKTRFLPLAALALACTSAVAGDTEKKVKVIEYKTDIELISDGATTPIKLQFDGKPSEQQIEDAVAGLPPEKQEKVRQLLRNLEVENDEGLKVFAFKSGEGDIEKHIEIHADEAWSSQSGSNVFVLSDGEKQAQVFKFKFEGDESDGPFHALKHLLNTADLTPMQIVELQNILSQK
ncbi:hypothetical protein AN214_02996 [Pseudoalteromonas sp. P1-9]|uniref:hypothetical protein n=1 Tax=Pseudoalteromonas sp. P1-9 TaxID=1710354 RepID=UPI0006D5FA75|nr:hypothetical protein [Pseudoalteromonas sp. P1-9]KPV94961.1 hypothetical protein AN214_02996 [Pseudoalteromonas sp. P1-9]